MTLALLMAASCGGSSETPTEEQGSELSRLALQPDEVPDGLELDEDASGAMESLRDVLPPQADAPQLPPLAKEVRRAFLAGYDALYRDEQGETEVTSSVIRFADAGSATAFLSYLRDVQAEAITAGSSEVIETPGLGDEGYGFHRSAPGAETSGCSWRRADLVFTITLSSTLGQAPAERALDLARLLDERAG